MKCVLHIGTEKTGTTSIQKFLLTNQAELKKQGYSFLKSLGVPNNKNLSLIAYNDARRDILTQRKGIETTDDLNTFRINTIRGLKSELQLVDKKGVVVFSDEYIQSRLTKTEELYRLKELLGKLGFNEIRVLLYIRKPAETANSLYSTEIKSGGTSPKVPPPTHGYYNNVCNHELTIKRFSEVFGRSNLIVRLFRKDRFLNGSLIEDFACQIGIEINDRMEMPMVQNESMSSLGLQLLQGLNVKFQVNQVDRIVRGNLVKFFSKVFNDSKYKMDESIYDEYEKHFESSNNWVKENYFPEEKNTLFSEKQWASNTSEISKSDLNKMSDLLYAIWISREDYKSHSRLLHSWFRTRAGLKSMGLIIFNVWKK